MKKPRKPIIVPEPQRTVYSLGDLWEEDVICLAKGIVNMEIQARAQSLLEPWPGVWAGVPIENKQKAS